MNENIVKKYSSENNLKQSTTKGYVSALKKYESYHELSMDELLDEARQEEKNNIPLKDRKIRQRLMSFRQFLLLSSTSNKTTKTYFTRIKSIYRFCDIEMPELPKIKYPIDYESSYMDLPTKKDIKRAVEISSPLIRAIILFMVSSGTGKTETLSLKVQHFIDGTKEYHSGGSVSEILTELSFKRNVVPTFYLKRIKTDKFYFTFCSPEATKYIIAYLKSRENLKADDSLFDISMPLLNLKFRQINDFNNWGFKGRYRFFRSHVLRKFHASNIGLPVEYIDELQGRVKNEVHNAYVKTNPEELKKLYVLKMNNLKIMDDDEINEKDEEYNITINVFLSGQEFNIQ